MAKSSFGLDSVLRVATAPLPRPVQFALGSRFRFYLALICIGFAMFFGVIHFGWNNGTPSVTVDRQKLKELKQEGMQIVQNFQQAHPNSQLAPLVNSYLNNQQPQNTTLPNNQQPYNNGYGAPTYNTPAYNTGYNTTPPASHPMVYPQQPNYQQPLTGAPQQYRPNPYQNNPYQQSGYGQQQYANGYGQQPAATPYGTQPQNGTQPQYGTSYTNQYNAQPTYTPPSYNQYPTTNAYPNNAGYQGYGQPARTSVPQYGAPGYR